MTKTHQLLDLMRSGEPITYQKIMAQTGWSLEMTKKVIHGIMGCGYITHVPAQYVITAAGLDRQNVTPKTPRQAKTPHLLDLMRDGEPMTYAKIMAATGWSLETTKKVLHSMISYGYITHVPAQYAATQAGLDRQKVKPKTPRAYIDKRVAQRNEKRDREAVEKKRIECETTVECAKRTQPSSVFGLGAM